MVLPTHVDTSSISSHTTQQRSAAMYIAQQQCSISKNCTLGEKVS